MNINIRGLQRFLRRRPIRSRSCAATLAAAGALLARAVDGASADFTLYVANQLAYNSSPFTRYFTVEEFDSLGNASVFATNSSFGNPILNAPTSVAIDSSGNVYVACYNDDTWIERFDPWGNNAARFVNSTVSFPNAMVFDGAGNLYVAAGYSGNITEYNSQGSVRVYASTNAVGDLVGLAFDSTGNLYASDEFNGRIMRIDTQTNMTTFASPGNNPYGLAFDDTGDLYVALRGNGNIVKYSPGANGTLNTNATLFASLGGSTQPVGLDFDPPGNLYVSEYAANQIVRIDPTAIVTVFASTGLSGPVFIALQPKAFGVARYVVAGGGGTSSGGGWSVTGTAGQPDAAIMTGQFMNGELVGVEGGFFSGPVINFPISTNLLLNGGFSFGRFTNNHGADNTMSLYPGASNMPGWTVTGTAGYDLGWIGPINDLGLTAPGGGYFLDLTGYHDSAPYDGVSQTAPTIAGQTYHVSFEIGYSATYDATGLPAITVSVSNLSGAGPATYNFVASGTMPWQPFEFAFTAAASTTTLTFTGSTPQNVQYIGLANIIMWSAADLPIVMSAPTIGNGQLHLPFSLAGPGTTFELQQAPEATGPWTVSQGATMSTGADGTTGAFMIPVGATTQFYRVHSY